MINLKMIKCPKCSSDFPEKRKELGYHVCVKCSTIDKVVGITTVEGTGDHTYNDLIIMDRSTALRIAQLEAEVTGRGSRAVVDSGIEIQNYEEEQKVGTSWKKKTSPYSALDE